MVAKCGSMRRFHMIPICFYRIPPNVPENRSTSCTVLHEKHSIKLDGPEGFQKTTVHQ